MHCISIVVLGAALNMTFIVISTSNLKLHAIERPAYRVVGHVVIRNGVLAVGALAADVVSVDPGTLRLPLIGVSAPERPGVRGLAVAIFRGITAHTTNAANWPAMKWGNRAILSAKSSKKLASGGGGFAASAALVPLVRARPRGRMTHRMP